MILDRLRELDPAGLELGHGLFDVVAVERDLGGAGWRRVVLVRVNAEVCFRGVEDQPSLADVGQAASSRSRAIAWLSQYRPSTRKALRLMPSCSKPSRS
jgi:hypothetical protein